MLSKIQTQAPWFGIRRIKNHSTHLSCRFGVIEPITMSLDEGYRLEMMQEGQLVYVGFQDANDLSEAVEKAHALAKNAVKFPLYRFSQEERPKVIGAYDQSISITPSELQGWLALLHASDLKLKVSDLIIDSLAFLNIQEIEEEWVANNGTEVSQKKTLFLHTLKATASKNNLVQSRSNGSPCLQSCINFLEKSMIDQEIDKILHDVHQLVEAENCPQGKMDVLLHPDQLYLQIHESIGHPLELDRILGDERNYAGWSFVTLEDFGKLQYGSPLMNVTFDPTLRDETASYAFDDAGNTAKKEHIIKNGVLQRPLGSLESQKRSGLSGVANSRSTSWNRPPIDRMANLNLECGTSNLDDMIKGCEKGIYMETNNSWSIDDYRRKFQFGCEYARLIEDGRLTKVVRNPNYRGETLSFWNSLKFVGNDTCMWGSFYCGKGEPNQVIQVGHATPHALFTNIEVFGGQS